MYECTTVDAPLPEVRLRDSGANSVIQIAPGRGGMVTRFAWGGRDVLYLDEATLLDTTKNVRGGIPVLFPIAGKLKNERYEARGRSFSLKQHGFARNLPWTLVSCEAEREARCTLELASSDATRALYPWEFLVTFAYALRGASLTIEQQFENRDREPMPIHYGFHPYFSVPDAAKANANITTDATLAFDNTTGREVPFRGWDLTQREVDLHLLDHHARTTELQIGGVPFVRIDADESYRTLVVWTLAGKDFVCVEPWSAPGGAMQTGAGLIEVPPGETHRARVTITAL